MAEARLRRRNAERLTRAAGAAAVRAVPGATPSALRFPVVLPEVHEAARAGSRPLGIMPGYPLALPDLPGFSARCANPEDSFEGARSLARRLVTLPTHGLLAERDLSALEDWLRQYTGS
jgi:hypothetical protein